MSKDKFQNKYRIPSARAMWHDYNGGEYFITICTTNREHYFGAIRDGEMILNVLGQKLNELITEIPNHNPYAEIPIYQIMPNHVHLIVCIDGDVRGDNVRDAACHVSTGADNRMRDIANRCGKLSTAIGGLKSAITKFTNANKIEFTWQSRFHDHIIRNQDEMNKMHLTLKITRLHGWMINFIPNKFNIAFPQFAVYYDK